MTLRELLKTYPTAQAIHDHLATTATLTREEPVTYTDLLEKFTAAQVKALDGILITEGLEWLRGLLGGAGANFASQQVQGVFDALLVAGKLTAPQATTLKAIGVWTEPQWQVYGLAGLPTLAQIEAKIAEFVSDGRIVSMAVRVAPGRDSVAFSITEVMGDESGRIIESFAVNSADSPRLNQAQSDLVAAVLQLVKGYG